MWKLSLTASNAITFEFDTVREAVTLAEMLEDARKHSQSRYIISITDGNGLISASGVDTGKIYALSDAGWKPAKIADEMGLSEQTIRKYLTKRETPALSGK